MWAPLAARVLLRYRMVLPTATHAEWVQRLAAALPGLLPSGPAPEDHSPGKCCPLIRQGALHDVLRGAALAPCVVCATLALAHLAAANGLFGSAEGAVWALRYAHALALAAPSTAASTGPGAGQTWLKIWDAVTARTRAPGLPAGERDDALWLLSCIADRGLAPLPPGVHRSWGVPLLHKHPTPAAFRFVEATLRAGADSLAHAGQWEDEALTWLSQPGAVLDPACDAAGPLGAYLRLPPEQAPASGSAGGAEHEARPPGFSVVLDYGGQLPWAWWEGDGELERRLAVLCRGARGGGFPAPALQPRPAWASWTGSALTRTALE